MSSEEEATAANVLSRMSQIQQINPCETIDATVVVGHHCDVETTGSQDNQETTTTVEVSPEVLQQVQAAFQQELPQLATGTSYVAITKADDGTHTIIHEPQVQVINDGIQCTTCSKPGKSYTCEHCGKKFNKSYNLKTHIRVHTGERPYTCEVCGHGFANLGDLKRHSRTHTGEKPFKCEFCGKVFSDFGSHKRHLRLHTGYKPFKCDQCEREFTRLDSFKNHLRLHTGDRPYKCETCGKEFNYLTTYKRHLNIHKGEKPYACTECDKRFTRQNYLTNHMNTHSKIINQECQTDGGVNEEQERERMNDTEEQTAADSLTKVSLVRNEGKTTDQHDDKAETLTKPTSTKIIDTSILQQVTQVLGEMIPQNVSAELSDSAGGSHIVLQGTDNTGGEFKVTLAQQLLIAQHILNQAQIQRSGSHGDEESNTVTTVSLPEITPELAEQIVNQVALQHDASASNSETILPSNDVQVIQVSSDHLSNSNQQELVVEGHLITQEQISDQVTLQADQIQSEVVSENVMNDSDVVITTVSGPTQDSAVYVAVDPSQPDVQQILGEIQVLQSSENVQCTEKQT